VLPTPDDQRAAVAELADSGLPCASAFTSVPDALAWLGVGLPRQDVDYGATPPLAA